MSKVACVYCGAERSSISDLTSSFCRRNPNGDYHVPYEGSIKSKYSCKYCGAERSSIADLTSDICRRNPNGDYHSPSM